jgi:hypothetical protein
MHQEYILASIFCFIVSVIKVIAHGPWRHYDTHYASRVRMYRLYVETHHKWSPFSCWSILLYKTKHTSFVHLCYSTTLCKCIYSIKLKVRMFVCLHVCLGPHGSFKSHPIRSIFDMELHNVTGRDLRCSILERLIICCTQMKMFRKPFNSPVVIYVLYMRLYTAENLSLKWD